MWEVGAEAWGQVAERSLFFHNRIQSLDSQCPSAGSLRILPPGPSRETSGAARVEGLAQISGLQDQAELASPSRPVPLGQAEQSLLDFQS